jgi:hypothetical protein
MTWEAGTETSLISSRLNGVNSEITALQNKRFQGKNYGEDNSVGIFILG